jgi:hypothetical protein
MKVRERLMRLDHVIKNAAGLVELLQTMNDK